MPDVRLRLCVVVTVRVPAESMVRARAITCTGDDVITRLMKKTRRKQGEEGGRRAEDK